MDDYTGLNFMKKFSVRLFSDCPENRRINGIPDRLWRGWWLPIIVVLSCGLLQVGMPATNEALRYHRVLISDGELWRLFSAHFIHLGWRHYLMNGTALLLIYWLYADRLSPLFVVLVCLASSLAVGLGLLVLSPHVTWYVGLSGVLHGLFAFGALCDLPRRRWIGIVVLSLLILKLAWEQRYGPIPGSESTAGGPVIVSAHLYGAVGGLLTFVGLRFIAPAD